MLSRTCAALCFLIAVALLGLASWLFAEGQIPPLQLSGHSYIAFGNLSINGVDLPAWTFYFIPGGLCLVAGALVYFGWRLSHFDRANQP